MSTISVRDFKNDNDNQYQLKKMYRDSVSITTNIYNQILLWSKCMKCNKYKITFFVAPLSDKAHITQQRM